MRTKWEILLAEKDKAKRALDTLQEQIDYLQETPCGVDECSTCKTKFETEKDFADHYVVSDERYYNLGNCPSGSKRIREHSYRSDTDGGACTYKWYKTECGLLMGDHES